jgi:lipid-A-disaccharide synthase
MSVKKSESYFISACEHSGDLLGADLVLALRERLSRMNSFGIAGQAMINAGVDPVAHVSDFSVMGITEVAKKIPDLKLLESRVLSWIEQTNPKFAILIDSPAFHIRLAEQLKMRGIPVIQYVAPKLWAWGENRVSRVRDAFELVLGILPFEEDFYKDRGVNYEYVGSPQKDRIDKVIIKRSALGLPEKRPVIACLPGSRMAEIQMNLPIIESLRRMVLAKIPDVMFVVPVALNLDLEEVFSVLTSKGDTQTTLVAAGNGVAVESWDYDGLRFVRGMSLEIMAAADAAIVASGTATLECALLGTPMVVIYRMSDFSYQVAKKVVKLQSVSLVNLIAGQKLVKEFIQDFSYEDAVNEVVSIIQDKDRRKFLTQHFEEIRDRLKGAAAETAAQIISKRFGDSRNTQTDN